MNPELQEKMEKAIQDIAANHHTIIDDWCKAYMAQLYEEGHHLKPGAFTLNEQVPTFNQDQNCMVKRYWFTPGIPFKETDRVAFHDLFLIEKSPFVL